MTPSSRQPRIAITPDLEVQTSGRLAAVCVTTYLDAVHAAGGTPIVLAPVPERAALDAELYDAFIFTGGNDPLMEAFGKAMHPKATPVNPRRQAYELALLEALRARAPDRPVLGICLGMQLMCLHAGGDLDQHLPDTLPTHTRHKNAAHAIAAAHEFAPRWLPSLRDPANANATVQSNHHQAVKDAGSLLVLARSDDGLIEAVGDPNRPFYVGVQWHPERTESPGLGRAIFDALVVAVSK